MNSAIFVLVLLPFAHGFFVLAVNHGPIDVERGPSTAVTQAGGDRRHWYVRGEEMRDVGMTKQMK